ncbi:MAG: HNH endonuclease signature motif containing protein [Spirochaetales bacterium]|jgi:5-methylcytosine-specific restriction endonuclease McrA|nr:HNH endonuclease signature motif containing protein [Spirochaetales bacterium]
MEDKKEIARLRASKWYYENHERATASRRVWYLRNKEKMRKYQLEYRTINHDKLLQYDKDRSKTEKRIEQYKKWRDNNPETNRAKTRKWALDNPEWAKRNMRDTNERRRANMRKVSFEKIDREIVYLEDDGICGICGKPLEVSELTLDHIVPISKGGGHLYANVHSAHRGCNIRRGTRPLDFLYSI